MYRAANKSIHLQTKSQFEIWRIQVDIAPLEKSELNQLILPCLNHTNYLIELLHKLRKLKIID